MFLLLAVVACFSFTTTTTTEKSVIVEEVVNPCGENATAISSSCWSGCVSVQRRLTGVLEVDVAIVNEGPRKPSAAEFQQAQEFLDDMCAS